MGLAPYMFALRFAYVGKSDLWDVLGLLGDGSAKFPGIPQWEKSHLGSRRGGSSNRADEN